MAIEVTTNSGTITVPDRQLLPYKNINLIGLKYITYATQINNNFAKLAETDETIAQGLYALSGGVDANTQDIADIQERLDNILTIMSTDTERMTAVNNIMASMETADAALQELVNAKVGSAITEW